MKTKQFLLASILVCALAVACFGIFHLATPGIPPEIANEIVSKKIAETRRATDKTLRSITLGNWLKVAGDLDGKAELESEVWTPGRVAIVSRFVPVVVQQKDGTYLVTFKPTTAEPAAASQASEPAAADAAGGNATNSPEATAASEGQ